MGNLLSPPILVYQKRFKKFTIVSPFISFHVKEVNYITEALLQRTLKKYALRSFFFNCVSFSKCLATKLK